MTPEQAGPYRAILSAAIDHDRPMKFPCTSLWMSQGISVVVAAAKVRQVFRLAGLDREPLMWHVSGAVMRLIAIEEKCDEQNQRSTG